MQHCTLGAFGNTINSVWRDTVLIAVSLLRPIITCQSGNFVSYNQTIPFLSHFETNDNLNQNNGVIEPDMNINSKLKIDDETDNDIDLVVNDDYSIQEKEKRKNEISVRFESLDLKQLTRLTRSRGKVNNKYE